MSWPRTISERTLERICVALGPSVEAHLQPSLGDLSCTVREAPGLVLEARGDTVVLSSALLARAVEDAEALPPSERPLYRARVAALLLCWALVSPLEPGEAGERCARILRGSEQGWVGPVPVPVTWRESRLVLDLLEELGEDVGDRETTARRLMEI